jgi:hypothetical protein
MPETHLPVEHLFTLRANLGPATVIQGGPQGNRVLVPVPGGSFEGAKLRGTVVANSGGDWVTQRADGSVRLDVRITLMTDDGAAIYMAYNGIGVPGDGGLALRTAPLFETGAEKYAWLNAVQGVAAGASASGTVTYEVYALKV